MGYIRLSLQYTLLHFVVVDKGVAPLRIYVCIATELVYCTLPMLCITVQSRRVQPCLSPEVSLKCHTLYNIIPLQNTTKRRYSFHSHSSFDQLALFNRQVRFCKSLLSTLVHPQTTYIISKMAARPTVSVFSAQGESSGSLPLPAVFTAPIRLDVVQQVHSEFTPIGGRLSLGEGHGGCAEGVGCRKPWGKEIRIGWKERIESFKKEHN